MILNVQNFLLLKQQTLTYFFYTYMNVLYLIGQILQLGICRFDIRFYFVHHVLHTVNRTTKVGKTL